MTSAAFTDILRELERHGLFERLELEGPVQLTVSEKEYELLCKAMKYLWDRAPGGWGGQQFYVVLAFFRAYTFYKELSENDNHFWTGLQKELGLPVATVQGSHRDELWKVFGSHSEVSPFRTEDARGRKFVALIDAVWGIGRLRASELERFFLTAFREFPGTPVTASLMRQILPDLDDAACRQASTYHRVFEAMTQIVNYVLEEDVNTDLPIEQIEAMLGAADVPLGEPNAIRLFQSKSDQAFSRLIAELRRQRNEEQFRKYLLERVPLNRFRLPDRTSANAKTLAQKTHLDFGRYYDETAKQSHQLTPSARISLDAIERLPRDQIVSVSGLEICLSRLPFEINTSESSRRIFLAEGIHHIWVGRTRRDAPAKIKRHSRTQSVNRKQKPEPWTKFIKIQLDDDTFEAGSDIHLQFDDLPSDEMTCVLAGRIFPIFRGTVHIGVLDPGMYPLELRHGGTLFSTLEAITVLPSLYWRPTRGTGALIEGRVETGELRLSDGQYTTFRWRPRCDELGSPIPQEISVNTKHFEWPSNCELTALKIRIEAQCLAYRFENAELDPRQLRGGLFNPYKRGYAVRFILRSQPDSPETEFIALKPRVRDELLIETCLNYRPETLEKHSTSDFTLSPTWAVLHRQSIQLEPKFETVEAHGDILRIQARGPIGMQLQITETDLSTNRSVSHHYEIAPSNQLAEFRLRHPSRMRRTQVEATLRAGEFSDQHILEVPARLDIQASLRQGLAWASRMP